MLDIHLVAAHHRAGATAMLDIRPAADARPPRNARAPRRRSDGHA